MYVAVGVARQAAWTLAGAPEPLARRARRHLRGRPLPEIRERYAQLREATPTFRA